VALGAHVHGSCAAEEAAVIDAKDGSLRCLASSLLVLHGFLNLDETALFAIPLRRSPRGRRGGEGRGIAGREFGGLRNGGETWGGGGEIKGGEAGGRGK